MFITENKGAQQWAKMLKENFNVQDTEKLNWVSEYAAVHEIKESQIGQFGGGLQATANGVGSLYATPLNTTGMGNVAAPGAPSVGGPYAGAPDSGVANFFNQQTGSGDIPVSTLPMALNIALLTIGLELLPVIPAKGPWALLTYMDTPYAGGKLGGKNEIASIDGKGVGAENKPLYFKVVIPVGDITKFRTGSAKLEEGKSYAINCYGTKLDSEGKTVIDTTAKTGTVNGKFKTIGRMDGGLIFQIIDCKDASDSDTSLKEAFKGGAAVINNVNVVGTSVDFAQTHVDFVDGFANFANGSKKPMSRAENETGTGNVIGLRLFSKWIAMGSYEVTATVTRQQLQDLPLYGVDAVSKVMEACQNEITQTINARILEHVFALGVTNAVKQKARQGVDLNLFIGTNNGTGKKNLADFGISTFKDIYEQEQYSSFTNIQNADTNSSAENLYTRQRRISSRVLAAANLIQVTGRRGRANWIVTNAQIATALQDCAGYVVAPMVNNLLQDGSRDLYQAGSLAGIKVYVDPYMDWDDCRICVGRKGNGNEPGAVFMPYILADTVSITAEGTMAPKMLVNSRYAIADAGFFPETQYFTFAVNNEYGWL